MSTSTPPFTSNIPLQHHFLLVRSTPPRPSPPPPLGHGRFGFVEDDSRVALGDGDVIVASEGIMFHILDL